jgi:ABC-2 type transport system ATP-binding protein
MSVLEVKDVVKRYRNGTLANDGISLSLEPGEVYGLLGPNGAGKTTLVGQILGLLKPTAGSIHVNGVDVVKDPGYARKSIAFLPQAQVSLDDIHVDELIHTVARLRGLSRKEARARTEELIDVLQLEEFRHTAMSSTSGGARRLASFATAVVAPAKLIVLDEPTNDVDPVRRKLLWNMVGDFGRQGAAVLLVTHNLAEAERFIHRLAIIDHGRIVSEGSPASLRTVVTDQLRLEVTTSNGLVPHAALTPEPGGEHRYLFSQTDLPAVSEWLAARRDAGEIVDFRIGPPSLDDIYQAVVAAEAPSLIEEQSEVVA